MKHKTKYQVGDLILHNGLLWTIVSREKRRYIVLESGKRRWMLWTYEIDHMLKKHPDTKYFPVVE